MLCKYAWINIIYAYIIHSNGGTLVPIKQWHTICKVHINKRISVHRFCTLYFVILENKQKGKYVVSEIMVLFS